MDGAVSGDGKYGIIRSQIFFSLWKHHENFCGLFRAVGGRPHTRLGAYGDSYVFVADLSGGGALGEIFGVDRISSWIVVADACYGPFSGLAADLCRFYAVRDSKAGILHSLMNPVHNIAPDIFVEGGTAVIYISMG